MADELIKGIFKPLIALGSRATVARQFQLGYVIILILLTVFSGIVLFSTQRISTGVDHLNTRVIPAAQTVGEVLVEITKLQNNVNNAIHSQDNPSCPIWATSWSPRPNLLNFCSLPQSRKL